MKSQGVYHAIAEMHRDEEAVSAAVATSYQNLPEVVV